VPTIDPISARAAPGSAARGPGEARGGHEANPAAEGHAGADGQGGQAGREDALMGMRYRDLTGRQGDWLVKVTWEDGSIELVPTAHDKFYDGATGIYRRTDNSMERFKGKLSSWKNRIHETHKVVLTYDDWDPDAPLRIGHTPPKRSGYVGVFDISELECEGTGAVHSFKVVKRYEKTGR
jgi:hypothetical protein